MASFQKYETKKGIKWLFITENGVDPATGKRKQIKRRGFNTKKEAQEVARKIEQNLATGNFIENTDLTFSTVYSKWRVEQEYQVKPTTFYAVGCKFKKHILPSFGEMKIQKITRVHCQKFINDLANTTLKNGQRFKSVNDYKMYTAQILKYAMEQEIINKNPMEFVKVPKVKEEFFVDTEKEELEKFWDKDEALKFIETLETHGTSFDKIYFKLLLSTGLRKAEALGLTWDNIDFKEKTITINKNLTFVQGQFRLQKTKTKKSTRIISIDDGMVTLLKDWKTEQSKPKIISIAESARTLLFSRECGSPIRLPYPNERLKILIEKGQLKPITVHGLRHTHASLLFEAGANIKDVQERLGHTDVTMTMNIYTHVTKNAKAKTAEIFKNFIAI